MNLNPNIPLSDAIMLGSTLIRPVPYMRDDENGGGCAFGMAEAAGGSRLDCAEIGYPWLLQPTAVAPCGCTQYKQRGFVSVYSFDICCMADVVVHVFNEHVCEDKSWTLERLCDWIKTVEPRPTSVPAPTPSPLVTAVESEVQSLLQVAYDTVDTYMGMPDHEPEWDRRKSPRVPSTSFPRSTSPYPGPSE